MSISINLSSVLIFSPNNFSNFKYSVFNVQSTYILVFSFQRLVLSPKPRLIERFETSYERRVSTHKHETQRPHLAHTTLQIDRFLFSWVTHCDIHMPVVSSFNPQAWDRVPQSGKHHRQNFNILVFVVLLQGCWRVPFFSNWSDITNALFQNEW